MDKVIIEDTPYCVRVASSETGPGLNEVLHFARLHGGVPPTVPNRDDQHSHFPGDIVSLHGLASTPVFAALYVFESIST